MHFYQHSNDIVPLKSCNFQHAAAPFSKGQRHGELLQCKLKHKLMITEKAVNNKLFMWVLIQYLHIYDITASYVMLFMQTLLHNPPGHRLRFI